MGRTATVPETAVDYAQSIIKSNVPSMDMDLKRFLSHIQ
jgi:hypothetical protein